MSNVEITVYDCNGKEISQKVPAECEGCGYFYADINGDDPYHKCHYPDNKPSAWAPCNIDEPVYDD